VLRWKTIFSPLHVNSRLRPASVDPLRFWGCWHWAKTAIVGLVFSQSASQLRWQSQWRGLPYRRLGIKHTVNFTAACTTSERKTYTWISYQMISPEKPTLSSSLFFAWRRLKMGSNLKSPHDNRKFFYFYNLRDTHVRKIVAWRPTQTKSAMCGDHARFAVYSGKPTLPIYVTNRPSISI